MIAEGEISKYVKCYNFLYAKNFSRAVKEKNFKQFYNFPMVR